MKEKMNIKTLTETISTEKERKSQQQMMFSKNFIKKYRKTPFFESQKNGGIRTNMRLVESDDTEKM